MMKSLLSKREIEVLEYCAQGYTAKEIAELTCLGRRTIEGYMIKIETKLQARNMPHAIAIASQKNLINVSKLLFSDKTQK